MPKKSHFTYIPLTSDKKIAYFCGTPHCIIERKSYKHVWQSRPIAAGDEMERALWVGQQIAQASQEKTKRRDLRLLWVLMALTLVGGASGLYYAMSVVM